MTGYVQNEEQNSTNTIWSRILNKPKPLDELYKFYGNGEFNNFIVDNTTQPELYNFVETIKKQGAVFGNYSEEQLKYFAELINELRKNNTNNAA